MFTLPKVTRPAALVFQQQLRRMEMKLSSIFEPAVVLMPLVQKISLCARGIPVKAVALPAFNAASAASASARACSGVTVT